MIRRFCVPLVIAICLLPGSVFAYLDPGTGSMLLQLVLGGAAAVGVVFKLFWHRIRRTLGFGSKADTQDEKV